MKTSASDHYAILGLDRRCTFEQIRVAYCIFAKRYHPDVNPGSTEASAQMQAVNAAYEILSDPVRRSEYDEECKSIKKTSNRPRAGKIERNISQDVQLRIEDFLRGTSYEVRVNDPANPDGPETYDLIIPPETAPGTLFRVPRMGAFAGGFVLVKAKASPNFRFKVRGSDLRCDLRINSKRAAQGGSESVQGANGARVSVRIPAGVGRNEVLRVEGEGLPKPRGGRGDLLVRITYRPEVKIIRTFGR